VGQPERHQDGEVLPAASGHDEQTGLFHPLGPPGPAGRGCRRCVGFVAVVSAVLVVVSAHGPHGCHVCFMGSWKWWGLGTWQTWLSGKSSITMEFFQPKTFCKMVCFHCQVRPEGNPQGNQWWFTGWSHHPLVVHRSVGLCRFSATSRKKIS
jgi:hypothetical protein